MNRKTPTILILMVMAMVGAMHWVDLSYYTDIQTGFVIRGTVWMRYAIIALPILMGLLGLRTVGPRAIAVLRVRNKGLAALFAIISLLSITHGVIMIVLALKPFSLFYMLLGALFVWYGVWMFLVALQLFVQVSPSPTTSAFWGALAALPFCALTVYRIMVRPSTVYRVGPLVRSLSALFAMLWFGMLLRALYIALPRSRVRWMYLLGVLTFLFATCLEMPQTIFFAITLGVEPLVLTESIILGTFGLVAGCVSVAIASQSEVSLRVGERETYA